MFHSKNKCGGRELNPHTFRHRLLRPACLPFHHLRKAISSISHLYNYVNPAPLDLSRLRRIPPRRWRGWMNAKEKLTRRDVTKWACSTHNVGRDNPAEGGVHTGTTGMSVGVPFKKYYITFFVFLVKNSINFAVKRRRGLNLLKVWGQIQKNCGLFCLLL